MPRDKQTKTEPKNSAPTKKGRLNTKARQRRHERAIQKARERREWLIQNGTNSQVAHAREQEVKIAQKAQQRRRFARLFPHQKAEAREKGAPSRVVHR